MNKIYIILPLLVSLITFSSHSNGEWSIIASTDIGDEFFIDMIELENRVTIYITGLLTIIWNQIDGVTCHQ